MLSEGRVVDHLLKGSEKITLRNLVDMYLDASRCSYTWDLLKPHILKTYGELKNFGDPLANDPMICEVIGALERWNGCEFEKEADHYNFQAVILDEWTGKMMQRIFDDKFGLRTETEPGVATLAKMVQSNNSCPHLGRRRQVA